MENENVFTPAENETESTPNSPIAPEVIITPEVQEAPEVQEVQVAPEAPSAPYTPATPAVRRCVKCQAVLSEGQNFCAECGASQQKSTAPHYAVATEPAPQQYSSPQQPTYTVTPQGQPAYTPPPHTYEPPVYTSQTQTNYTAQQGFAPAAPAAEQDMMMFLQKNQMYYMSEFAKLRVSANKISWNWCSFLFGSCWMAYRKMIWPALAVIVVASILGRINGLFSVLLWVAQGLFGNYLYMLHVDREIASVAITEPTMRNITLASKGGVSAGLVFAAIAATGLLTALFGG